MRAPSAAYPRAILALLALPFLVGAAAAPADSAEVVFSFADTRIAESSGLVALGSGLFVTTNDSGDSGRVFTVDGRGRTVGVSTWSDDARDVEALAPAGPGRVWVGDIGDNRASRDTIQVVEVPVGPGARHAAGPVYDLAYPDGSHDAETLLAADGRLYVVTKGVLGGAVYAAPAKLVADRANRLTRVADRILPMATDGAVLPDGRHVLIRGYVGATLYTFPDFDRVAAVPLPRQPQGEGLAVAPDGTVYLSSEGVGAEVLRLPSAALCEAAPQICVVAPSGAAQPEPTANTAPSTAPEVSDAGSGTRTDRPWWPWVVGGVVVGAVVWLQTRLTRRR